MIANSEAVRELREERAATAAGNWQPHHRNSVSGLQIHNPAIKMASRAIDAD